MQLRLRQLNPLIGVFECDRDAREGKAIRVWFSLTTDYQHVHLVIVHCKNFGLPTRREIMPGTASRGSRLETARHFQQVWIR